ncbi:MAG: PQQ-binding-like beta-propeller repeat protein [Beutenbergiaceae bacterium]
MDDLQRSKDPQTGAAELQEIALRSAQARPLIAEHPNASPELVTWLGALGDPSVDSALARRAAALEIAAARPSPRRRRRAIVGGALALALLTGGAFAGPAIWNTMGDDGPAAVADDSDTDTGPTFLDGGELGWTLNAADLVPERADIGPAVFNLRFEQDIYYGQGMDDGPVAAGKTWVVGIGYRSAFADEAGSYAADIPVIEESVLVGFDGDTGQVRWRLDESLTKCVALDDTIVCAAMAMAGPSELVAINAADGSVQWRQESVDSTEDLWLAGADGVVAVAAEGIIAGHDATTGEELWTTPLLPTAEAAVIDLALLKGVVQVDSSSGRMMVDLQSGAPIASTADGWLATANGRVFEFGSDPSTVIDQPSLVDSLDLADEGSGQILVPGAYSAHLVELDYGADTLSGLDLSAGTVLWQVSQESGVDSLLSTKDLAVTDRGADNLRLTFRTGGNELIFLDPTGVDSEISVLPLPEPPLNEWRDTVASYGLLRLLPQGVVAYTTDGRTSAYDAFTGTLLWSIEVPGEGVMVPPAGTHVVVSEDRMTLSRVIPAALDTAAVLPTDLPACPDDAIELARAELNDGWALVCGNSAVEPTYMAIHSQTVGDLESNDVVYDDDLGRYTAIVVDGSTVWLNHTPSTVGIRSAAGVTVMQDSVVSTVFDALGEGSQGQGVGAYGVAAPEHTAQAQVEYLAQILSSSEEARSDLGPVLQDIASCSQADGDYSSQIATIEQVRDSRVEQRAALRSAPVDLVPQGTELIDELTTIGLLSYLANDSDVSLAGEQELFDSCTPFDLSEIDRQDESVVAARELFAQRWNSEIAPVFDVPAVSSETL